MNTNKNQCRGTQQRILESNNPAVLLESNGDDKKHLERCPECRLFFQSTMMMHKQMKRPPLSRLHPNRNILGNLQKRMNIRRESNIWKEMPLWQSMRQIFEYRIPLYQALSGLVVMVMIIFFLSGTVLSPELPWPDNDRSAKVEGINDSDLYIVDSLNLFKPERGQNVREDSVLVGFLVPTL